jgi:hypothetical protein
MTQANDNKFIFPAKTEDILAALSHYYQVNNQPLIYEIITKSTYDFILEYTYDNWDGGMYGHILNLYIPLNLHSRIFENLEKIEEQIATDINKISKISNEFISKVEIEIQKATIPQNWRGISGMANIMVDSKSKSIKVSKLWEPEYIRLFISHIAKHKILAAELKAALSLYGISSFVAHEDIEPTKEWQDEIELALSEMEVMIALLTNGFHDSRWTDQETGVALGRGIPVIPIKVDIDPYGFIGKYQALNGKKKNSPVLADEVFELISKIDYLKERATVCLITRFEKSQSFAEANSIIKRIAKLDTIPSDMIKRLKEAPKTNGQVDGAYEVQNLLPIIIKKYKGTK